VSKNEASARIKINRLLEDTGWRFFPDGDKPANVKLEQSTSIAPSDLTELGEDFEKASKGFIDFLLLDEKGFPLIVLEAKAEERDPLVGKEQARRYARSQNCRFVILSNGNLHYFWDLEHGNPHIITSFPTPGSVMGYRQVEPKPRELAAARVGTDYIALTQKPNYRDEVGWKREAERAEYIRTNKLRFLRDYQIRAIKNLQGAVSRGKDRFLFEMATGTGKTLTAAAVIKLFLRSGSAHRVLFLVDRLELEDQAKKAFTGLLANDYQTVIFKENWEDWRRAEIVISTVQSFLFNNKYQRIFSPTDFGLVISDEAHRSISGNARAVFEYFVGYKLGLTATPKDYLKNFDASASMSHDPREVERRWLLDTYRTFGCESGEPTFRYSLVDGVRDRFLINPTVVDAQTEVTTQLLSEQGFVVSFTEEGDDGQKETFKQREFEKRFFSEATNRVLCKTFLENALRDPISGEIGKSIIFAVSQNHAAKLSQILNQMADRMFPGKYQSDFAVQVTSQIADAQQFTINFSNNNLLGSANFLETYKTSKARVCVTVGMMTTGYDCPDILNLGLFRPIFSPADFIQIKGRGTRKHNFLDQLLDLGLKSAINQAEKTHFKLFDFFRSCEYFEADFNYDEVLELPKSQSVSDNRSLGEMVATDRINKYEHFGEDILSAIKEQKIGYGGMRIDREFFQRFEDRVKEDSFIAECVEAGEWDKVIDYVNKEVFDKPEEYYSLEKLTKAADVDRRLHLREILEKIFGLIPGFKSKDELLEEEFAKFLADYRPAQLQSILAMKNYFKAYASSKTLRDCVDRRQFGYLATNSNFSMRDLRAVPERYRELIPRYIKDYVPLDKFAA